MVYSVPKTSQCTKKVLSDSPGLEDYPSWLMNSGCHTVVDSGHQTDDKTLHLYNGQVKFCGKMFEEIQITDEVMSEKNFFQG